MVKSKVPPIKPEPTSAIGLYIGSVVATLLISVIAICARPDQAAVIIAFCGPVTAALIAMLKGHQETLGGQRDIHEAVNGKMQELIDISGSAREAKGHLKGKADERSEQVARDEEGK